MRNAERVSVTLPRELADALRGRARASGRSVAAVVRDAIASYLGDATPAAPPTFLGTGSSGRRDISERGEELISGRFRDRSA
jgi:plasmid stability protein